MSHLSQRRGLRPWASPASALACGGSLALWLALGLSGCPTTTKPRTEIVVRIHAEPTVAKALTRLDISLKALDGKDKLATHTFELSGTDPIDFPFSFTVTKGKAAEARLEVVGYERRSAGRAKAVIESKVIASFRARATLVLDLLLSEACLSRETLCSGDQTCYPFATEDVPAGACGAIPERTNLATFPGPDDPFVDQTKNPAGAVDVRDSGAEPDGGAERDAGTDAGVAPVCGEADGQCPPSCTHSQDADCPAEKGLGCNDQSPCQEGLYCVQGVCCDAPCDGACQVCNLSASAGTCQTLDFSADPSNCGACGKVCDYGVCEESACAEAFQCNSFSDEQYVLFFKDYVYAAPVSVSDNAELLALGVMTLPQSNAVAKLMLVADQDGPLGTVVVSSSELTVQDTQFTDIGARGTERILSAPLTLPGGSYWVVFLLSTNTQIYADTTTPGVWVSESSTNYATFSGALPTMVTGSEAMPSVYVITKH